MSNRTLIILALMTPLLASTSNFAQSAAVPDPACLIKNDDGTQKVNTAKCPDGFKVGTAVPAAADTSNATAAQVPADGSNSSTSAQTTDEKSNNAMAAQALAPAANAPALGTAIVSADKVTGTKLVSANDFIGKTVYSRADENIGKVHDVILSENGVQAVVLSVGGFLGLGSRDVAVSLASIDIAKDGSSTKLVVDATKDQLESAPVYDPKLVISAN
jgi:sporulation protein YlmC with PRC-barrel domain